MRTDALAIWRAGVEAVDSERLVSRAVTAWAGGLLIGGVPWLPTAESRICVVGGGKAGAGMVRGVVSSLGSCRLSRTSGWVNVPDDCVPVEDDSESPIRLHPARPGGVNEPTEAGVAGTQEILKLVGELGPDDLCLVLLSGGGSALLPAPVEGISLADKQLVTRTLSRSGADISQLNCVRRALSRIKGGGLLRACGAGTIISLIISDVAGDPLETIASGPTVDLPPDRPRAWELTQRFFSVAGTKIPESVERVLTTPIESPDASARRTAETVVRNIVIGNNRTAVEAAAAEARRRGWQVKETSWDNAGEAAQEGIRLATTLSDWQQRAAAGERLCLVSGGEPTVRIEPSDSPQKGGRNQQLVLAAACHWLRHPARNCLLLSAGTDGEDGPTDAAGAWVDSEAVEKLRAVAANAEQSLNRHNSYPLLDERGLLIKTGPTQTNVMDLRVGLVVGDEPRTK